MKRLFVLAFAAMLASVCLTASIADQDPNVQIRTMTIGSPGVSTYGTKVDFSGQRAVLWAQIPDSVAGTGFSCQNDTVYPFDSELADDIENNSDGTWNIDSIYTYWANWNGFNSWALVPNFRVYLYEDSGTLTMPKMVATQMVVVEAANYTAYGTGPYRVMLRLTGLGFTVPNGRWWLVVQPSTSFSANGQTGWQCSVGIGNGQEWYQSFPLLGIAKWTSASAQGYTGQEAGFVLFGEEASSGIVWDFEDGWQGWTHTGAAYPGGWGIGAWDLNGTTWVAPDHGDSSLWVDSDAAGSGVAIRDTAISPVFIDVPGGWLKWGIAFNFISANERLYLIMRGHDGTSWSEWDTLYYYPNGVDVSSRWDSVDVSAWLTYDALQMGIYYSDSSSWAWYGVFDNIGPVVLQPALDHDVASVGFLSPAATVAPSLQSIIGVVQNVGNYDETFDVHLVVTDLTDAVVLDTTVGAATLIGASDTLDFGQVAMQDGQTYTYTMATLLAGDANPANDTAVGTTVCIATFWEVLADIPAAKSGPLVGYEFDEVTGNAIIHVFGGNPAAQNTVQYSFDYGAKAWTGPFTMPAPKHYGGCISYNNMIYLLGGWSSPGTIMIYDCEGDTFHTAAVNLINAVNDPMVALDEGRELIYIIGGGNNATWTPTNYVQVFDINALTVTAGTAFPENRMAGAAAYLGNDTLFVSHGMTATGVYPTGTFYGVIDNTTPTTITWSAGPAITGTGCYRPGYADFMDALYVYGGGGTAYLTECWRFRTSDGWQQMPDLFGAGRQNLGGCGAMADTAFTDLAEGLMFAAGGYTPYSAAFGCLHTNTFNYIEEVPGEISEVFTAKLVSSNIFNSELRIEFNLPMSSNVRFTVYDVTGRTVTLDNYSNVGAGAHNLVWQGRDQSGREVSAGTYFFRLEAAASVFSGKIIVTE